MLGLDGAELGDQVTRVTLRNNLFFLLIALIAVTPLIHELDERTRRHIRRNRALRNIAVLKAQEEKVKQAGSGEEAVYYLVRMVLAVGLLLISVMAMIGQSYQPFLYNQF